MTGIISSLDHVPRDGLSEQTFFTLIAGDKIDPWVSVPNENVKRFNLIPAADPLDEPLTSSCISFGWRHWPPTAEKPDGIFSVNEYAHSDKFVRPRIRQPNLFI